MPSARVWAVLLDVERWPEWTSSVTRIQRMEVGPISMGSRARIWQPRLRPAVWRVTSFDDRRRIFAWTTRAFGVSIIGRHQVEALKNYTRVCLSIEYSGVLSAVVTRFYGDLSRDYIAREGDGLKKFCENLPASHPALQADEHVLSTAQNS
ncbi:MAG: SRPBCC family protein [Acidobacteria bacterium]|nr:SRPBCC family protein [Acidobacteriota bacterium]